MARRANMWSVVGASGSGEWVLLALTNRGGATGADLARLRDAVVSGVRERYGVTLVPEPVQVGF